VPVSTTLGYLKGVLPEGSAAEWVAAVSRRAFALYLRRLLALRALQEAADSAADGAPAAAADVAAAAAAPPALAFAEQLANALVAHLGDGGGGGGGGGGDKRKGGGPPDVGLLADDMLGQLLAAFPALHHSRAVLQALLYQLQREEGDTGLGALASSGRGLVWERTQRFVRGAADVAPSIAEAMVQSFLGGDGLLCAPQDAGALSSAGGGAFGGAGGALKRGGGGGGAAARGAAAALAGAGPRAAAEREAAAGQAAVRRAADLLRVCGEARARRAARGAGGEGGAAGGAYQGTLALSRKLHYSGYVRGLISQALADLRPAGAGGGGGGGGGPASDGGGTEEAASADRQQAAAIKEVGHRRDAAGAQAGPAAGAPAASWPPCPRRLLPCSPPTNPQPNPGRPRPAGGV
jgi:hypothetical protein